MEASSGRRLLDPLGQGTRKGTAVLADQVSCHHCSWFSAGRFNRKSGIPEGIQNFIWKTLHASARFNDSSQKCLATSPTPLWGLGAVPGKWADVCGFLKPPNSDGQWKVRQHGAFSIFHEALGIRPTDQSCHHEAWLHLDFVGSRNEQPHDRKILLKERSAPHHHGKQRGHISDVMSAIRCRRDYATIRPERITRMSSPSDLRSLPFQLTATCLSALPRSFIHIACMTISSRRAKKKEAAAAATASRANPRYPNRQPKPQKLRQTSARCWVTWCGRRAWI